MSVQGSRFKVRVRFVVRRSRFAAFAVLAAADGVALAQSGTVNWPLHNLDLAGGRFSPMDQINTANVATLTPRWLFQTGVIDGVSNQTTPVIVDGSMYVTDPRGSVYALDAADGHLLWTFDVTELIGGGAKAGYIFRNRGVCYADGVVYTGAGSFLFALDAKTGKPIKTLRQERPGERDPRRDQGALSRRHRGDHARLLVHDRAADLQRRASTSAARAARATFPAATCSRSTRRPARCCWHFNTIPQDGRDQGWEIAGPTWVGGERNGGGIWETPSIDPELGLLYVAVGNPFGDSSKRIGTNLFTDSILALSLSTGTLKWHYQQTHHDVWDYDSGNQPILFDMQVRGQRVKALAEASKNGYLYILNRETGQPVHPIKEMPVPTETTRPGEQPWPTQPIPFTAAGQPMKPVSPVFPIDVPAERLADEQARAAVHAAGTEPDLLAGHRGRRELRSALLQPADRAAVRQRGRQPARRAASRAGDISPPSIRRPASSRGSRRSTAGARRGRSSPRAASSSSAPAATSPATSSPTTRRPASCCGSSTPAPASSRRRRSTW